MEPSVQLTRLIGAGILLVPAYFIVVPWITRNWPTAKATVVEVVPKYPDGLFARYRRYREGRNYGIEYEVNGQRYRKSPNIEAISRVGSFSANSVSTIHHRFDMRYHPNNPNWYRVARAYKPWAKWSITLIFMAAGSAVIWSTFQ